MFLAERDVIFWRCFLLTGTNIILRNLFLKKEYFSDCSKALLLVLKVLVFYVSVTISVLFFRLRSTMTRLLFGDIRGICNSLLPSPRDQLKQWTYYICSFQSFSLHSPLVIIYNYVQLAVKMIKLKLIGF